MCETTKRFNHKVGNKEYSKWVVVLPDTFVTKLGWKEGTELELILEIKVWN